MVQRLSIERILNVLVHLRGALPAMLPWLYGDGQGTTDRTSIGLDCAKPSVRWKAMRRGFPLEALRWRCLAHRNASCYSPRRPGDGWVRITVHLLPGSERDR